jgi:putative endonuclease
MAKTDGARRPTVRQDCRARSGSRPSAPGLSAESRAAAFLMAKGYRILAKRFRTPYGEIDLVAKETQSDCLSSRSRPEPASMTPPMR